MKRKYITPATVSITIEVSTPLALSRSVTLNDEMEIILDFETDDELRGTNGDRSTFWSPKHNETW